MSLAEQSNAATADFEESKPRTCLLSHRYGLSLVEPDADGFKVSFCEYSKYKSSEGPGSIRPIRTLATFNLDVLAGHMKDVSGDHGFHFSRDAFLGKQLSDSDAHSVYVNKKDIAAMKKWLANTLVWASQHPAEEYRKIAPERTESPEEETYSLASEARSMRAASLSLSVDGGHDEPNTER